MKRYAIADSASMIPGDLQITPSETPDLPFLIGRSIARLGFIKEDEFLGESSRIDGLVDDVPKPARDIRIRLTPFPAVEKLEAKGDNASAEEVGKSETLADEIVSVLQVLFDHCNGPLGHLLPGFGSLFIEGADSHQHEILFNNGNNDLGIEERHPHKDVCIVPLILSE